MSNVVQRHTHRLIQANSKIGRFIQKWCCGMFWEHVQKFAQDSPKVRSPRMSQDVALLGGIPELSQSVPAIAFTILSPTKCDGLAGDSSNLGTGTLAGQERHELVRRVRSAGSYQIGCRFVPGAPLHPSHLRLLMAPTLRRLLCANRRPSHVSH